MPAKKNKSKKQTSNRRANLRELPDTALRYSGPYILPQDKQGKTLKSLTLHNSANVVAGAAGSISYSFNIGDPSGANAWNEAAALFDEFRVLSCRVEFLPYNPYNGALAVGTAITQTPLIVAFDRDSTPASPTAAQCQGYGSAHYEMSSNRFIGLDYKMEGPEEAVWVTTASPGSSKSRGFLLAGINAVTNNLPVGAACYTWIVQFRSQIG